MTTSKDKGKELLKKAEEVTRRIEPYVQGVVLVGSLAYGPETANDNSDVDLVVITRLSQLEAICNTYPFDKMHLPSPVVSSMYEIGADVYGLKENCDGIMYNVHFMPIGTFEAICGLSVSTVTIARKRQKTGQYRLLGVTNGSEIYWSLVTIMNRSFPLTLIPVYVGANDNFYIGNHPDKILSNGQVFIDKDGGVQLGVDKLYKNVVQEYMKYGGEIGSFPNVFVRRSRFSEEATKRVIERAMRAIS